jgi:hypothetical protein
VPLLLCANICSALNLGFSEVCIQNFPLPTLKHQLRGLRLEVHHGRGFCVIRGLDPKLYSPVDNTIIFLGLTSYIAERRGRQDQNGNMLGKATQALAQAHTKRI